MIEMISKFKVRYTVGITFKTLSATGTYLFWTSGLSLEHKVPRTPRK